MHKIKMRFHIIIIFLFVLGISHFQSVNAQRKNPLRKELNANLDMEDYNLVPCGSNGVIVFFESQFNGSALDTKRWSFAFYDKNLNEKWLADTALINGLKFRGYASNDEYTYLLFLETDKIKSDNNMQVLRINYSINEFTILEGLVPDKSEPVHFSIHDNKALIGLNNPDFEPVLVSLNLTSGTLRKHKPEIEGLNIIQEIHNDQDGNGTFVVVDNYLNRRQNAILILQLNNEGDVVNTLSINTAIEKKVLNEARIAYSGGDTLLILGTYNNSTDKINAKDEERPENAGYFICKFVANEEKFINYFNFLEFEEMYKSLNSQTVVELRKKAEKHKKQGEEYSLEYTLLLHKVIPFNNTYVLLSEAYYPEYRTVTNMYYDYYGRPVPQTYTVFDGYKYISGIAAAFSPQGELIWDNGIEIRDLLTFRLEKYVANYPTSKELALFYSKENKLFYKMLSEEGSTSLQSLTLESKYKADKLMEDLGSKIVHWYDNYFLCYGYQKIKNNRASDNKRTIFFFNKLAFK